MVFVSPRVFMNSRVPDREISYQKYLTAFVPHLTVSLLTIVLVFVLSQFALDGAKGFLVDLLFRTQWWSDRHRS